MGVLLSVTLECGEVSPLWMPFWVTRRRESKKEPKAAIPRRTPNFSHPGRVGLGDLALFDRPDAQRVQRLGLVEVQEGVVAPRQDRRPVVAQALVLRVVDNADSAVAALLHHLARLARLRQEQQLVVRAQLEIG